MVKIGLIDPRNTRELAFLAAPARRAITALFALDEALADVLRGSGQPMIRQLKLTWWHDALVALDTTPPPAQPVLRALAADVLPHGPRGGALAGLVEGWEELLDPGPLDDDVLLAYAAARGGRLFTTAGALMGAATSDPLAAAGEGWALADLAVNISDRNEARRASSLAAVRLAIANGRRWSKPGEPLAVVARTSARLLAGDGTKPAGSGTSNWIRRIVAGRGHRR